MNQVYFYIKSAGNSIYDIYSLNPFMNQVYFYRLARKSKRPPLALCLNPFMNQVYFYHRATLIGTGSPRLNPFMNQVYFYGFHFYAISNCLCKRVLIPL